SAYHAPGIPGELGNKRGDITVPGKKPAGADRGKQKDNPQLRAFEYFHILQQSLFGSRRRELGHPGPNTCQRHNPGYADHNESDTPTVMMPHISAERYPDDISNWQPGKHSGNTLSFLAGPRQFTCHYRSYAEKGAVGQSR